jgi:hypothetical protein
MSSDDESIAYYVHYEALDVYEQHSPKILGITKFPIQFMP